MGQLRALQAEVPAGGSCRAWGRNKGEPGGGKAVAAPDINQGKPALGRGTSCQTSLLTTPAELHQAQLGIRCAPG